MNIIQIKIYLNVSIHQIMIEHPSIKDGWFMEKNQELWPGQAMSLEVEEILFSEKSKFQDVLVFKR